MANYEGVWRSNEFRVKDAERFTTFIELWPAAGVEPRKDGMFIIYGTEGGFPSFKLNDKDEEVEASFIEELADHIKKNSVCVLMHVGHEALRYVNGEALAINGGEGPLEGRLVEINLDTIVKVAKKAFSLPVAEAAY